MLEEYLDQLRAFALGWLGWSYEQYLNTPVAIIAIAVEAKIDCIIKTSRNGGGEKKEKPNNLLDGGW